MRALVALLAASAILLLASCGSDSGGDASSSSVTTIRYARWGIPEEIQAERELVREFEAANPDIRVKIEFGSWGEYWNKLQAQMAAGTAPDVFLLNGGYLHEYASRGQLEDLQQRFAGDADLSEDDYFPVVMASQRFNGGLWALPRDCNTVAIFYNKSLFAKHGVEPPTADWTWDEFLAKARALTVDENKDGRMESYGFLASFESMEGHYVSWIWQNGGRVMSEDHQRAMIGEPAAVEALEFYSGLVTKEKVSPDAAQASTFGSNMFLTGKLAMASEGSWMLRTFSQIDGFEWGIAPLPRGREVVAPVNGLGNAVYARSRNKDAAWRLVKFLASRQYQERLAQSGTSIPALREVANSPLYLDGKPAGKDIFLAQIEHGRPLDFIPGFARVEDAVRSQLELVWLGRADVPTAMREAARRIDAILAEEQK